MAKNTQPRQTQAAEQKFAAERSHKASEIAYELCKVTAQACLLINGGAATAVIALLAKDNIDKSLLHYIPYSLFWYGVGVLMSAAMMFSTMMLADYWNYYWYAISYSKNDDDADAAETVAGRWHRWMYGFFIAAIASFLIASFILARALIQ